MYFEPQSIYGRLQCPHEELIRKVIRKIPCLYQKDEIVETVRLACHRQVEH